MKLNTLTFLLHINTSVVLSEARRPWGKMPMGRNVLPWGEKSINHLP